MSRFKLTIDTDNAAFIDAGGAQLARILRFIAEHVEYFTLPPEGNVKTQSVKDFNGNRVGGWSWTADSDCGNHPHREGYTHSDWGQQ